jgi:hypothetical protein
MGELVNGLPVYGQPLDQEAIRRVAGHPEQVVGAELLRREDGGERGVRLVRLRTGEIDVDVVVDRALDLAGASVRGVPVAWLSPTGVAGPWFAEPHGLGTFRTFFGGLLTTCGLDHTLGPATDTAAHFGYPGQSEQQYPLHGRISARPARLIGYGATLDHERPHLFVEGELRQATVFGETLLLRRRIEADVGGRTLRIRDTVRNAGYAPTPHAILYHVNAGWPVVAPGAQIVAAVGEPRVATETARGADWRAVDPPGRGAVEQVWEHTPRPGPGGLVRAAVLNANVGDGRGAGVEIAYDPATLPRLFQWRVMGEGHYVIGLEPGNLRIEGRRAARESGDLVVLEPGEERRYRLDIRLLWGGDDLEATIGRIGGT